MLLLGLATILAEHLDAGLTWVGSMATVNYTPVHGVAELLRRIFELYRVRSDFAG